MAQLLTSDPWTWQPERCNYDAEALDYIEKLPAPTGTVIHVGTGYHHHIGRKLAFKSANTKRRWATLGVTCSPIEMQAYIDWAIENPALTPFYQCLFGDAHLLKPALLPPVDVVSLPHLCELEGEYPTNGPAGLARMLWGWRLNPGGVLLAYTGSLAWQQAQGILDAICARAESVESVGQLRIYRKRGGN